MAFRYQGVSVLVDPSLRSYGYFYETFLPVLEHWKFPSRFVNISKSGMRLQSPSLILLLQPGIGRALSFPLLSAIERALGDGTGFFIADATFFQNPFLSKLNFKDDFPQFHDRLDTISCLKVVDHAHFTTATKKPFEEIPLSVSLTGFSTSLDQRWKVVVSANERPLLFFSKKKRIGCFLIEPQSLLERLGFGTSLDILYWKSIVYLARKPFAQLVPPPFLTFRIEDVIGEGEFRYLDFIIQQGFKVHLGLDLNDFDFNRAQNLRKYFLSRKAEFSPHAFTHYKRTPTEKTELIYVNFNGRKYSIQKLRENFKRLRNFERRAKIKFSPVLTYHYCQLGSNALPFLKKMDVRYFTFPFVTNVSLDNAMRKKWRCHPFGKLGLVCDRFPEDKSFYTICSLRFPSEKLENIQEMNVSLTSQLDFLYGLRLKALRMKFEQYQEAVDRIEKYAVWAYENLFFVNIFTHETLINYLRLSEFKKLIVLLKKRLGRYKPVHSLYQDIAEYFRQRSETRFQNCSVEKGDLICTILGSPKSVLDLTIYREKAERIWSKSQRIRFTKSKQVFYF